MESQGKKTSIKRETDPKTIESLTQKNKQKEKGEAEKWNLTLSPTFSVTVAGRSRAPPASRRSVAYAAALRAAT